MTHSAPRRPRGRCKLISLRRLHMVSLYRAIFRSRYQRSTPAPDQPEASQTRGGSPQTYQSDRQSPQQQSIRVTESTSVCLKNIDVKGCSACLAGCLTEGHKLDDCGEPYEPHCRQNRPQCTAPTPRRYRTNRTYHHSRQSVRIGPKVTSSGRLLA